MAGTAARITVAQIARVWLAPVGTAAPADAVIALAATWKDVGYFTPDSLSFATDPTFEEVRSHQSNHPTRRFQTGDAAAFEVDLQEWSADNFSAVYGGGTVSVVGATTPPTYKFTPPAIGGRKQVAAIIEVIDGAKNYRRIMPKVEQNEGVTQALARTSESTLPLRMTVVGSDVGEPWYDLTNDPAFASISLYGT